MTVQELIHLLEAQPDLNVPVNLCIFPGRRGAPTEETYREQLYVYTYDGDVSIQNKEWDDGAS